MNLKSNWNVILISVFYFAFLCIVSSTAFCMNGKRLYPLTSIDKKKLLIKYAADSFSNPHQVKVNHIHLQLSVDPNNKILYGQAYLTIEIIKENQPLILDSKDLDIQKIEISDSFTQAFKTVDFKIGENTSIGQSISILLESKSKIQYVKISYNTSSAKSYNCDKNSDDHNLQSIHWSLSKTNNILLQLQTSNTSNSARSWIPCQDTVYLKHTYSAFIKVPNTWCAYMNTNDDATNVSNLKATTFCSESAKNTNSIASSFFKRTTSISPSAIFLSAWKITN